MAKMTDARVAGMKLPPEKQQHDEPIEDGLYLRLTRRVGGEVTKTWRFRVQVDHVRKWLVLGVYPAVTLAKAREEVRLHRVAQEAAKKGEGEHPVIAAQFARKAAREALTVNETFDRWIADKRMGSPKKGGVPVRERTIAVLTENYNLDIRDRIGSRKIAKLENDRDAIAACIDACRQRGSPGAAQQVYRTLNGVFLFARKRDLIVGDPMRGIDEPRPYRPPLTVNAATDAELRALLHCVDQSKLWLSTRLLIELLTLTGVRSSEARLATWSEIDFEKKLWTIPAERTKQNRPHEVHLSAQALTVLERAKIIHSDDTTNTFHVSPSGKDFVFPGSSGGRKGGPVEKMAIARALARLTDRIGKRLRPHDLRRSLRTLMSRLGVAPHIAELTLGHVEKNVLARIYDGHDFRAEQAAAWDLVGAHLASLRQGGAEVISIKSGKAA